MNLRKGTYLLMTFFFAYNMEANAQISLGIEGGVTNNGLNIGSQYINLKVSSKAGYMVNILIKYKIDKCLALEVSPGVIQKNYTIRNLNNIYQNVNNTYLHLPLSMKCDVYLIKNMNFTGSLGIYYAYWVNSVIIGVAPNVFEQSSNPLGEELIRIEDIKYSYKFTKEDNESEFGWTAKMGFDYKVSTKLSCQINGHYYQGLTGQQKRIHQAQSPIINKTLALTSGVFYRF